MKIAVLTEIISTHSGSRAPLEIAKNLARLNQKVTVYAHAHMLDIRTQRDLQKQNVSVKVFNKPNLPVVGKYIAAIKLLKALRLDKPQIMTYSGTFPFFAAGILSGIPIVRIYQGTQFDAFLERKIPGEITNLTDKLINFTANVYIYIVEFLTTHLSKGLITISEFTRTEAERLYGKKVDQVIYHGTTKLKNLKNQKYKESFTFIAVSRITPYKGFHLIIKALKKVKTKKNIKLAIAGSQPQKRYLDYLNKLGGKNIKIFLNPSDSELASLYQNSKIYLNADKHLYFGLPIMEAAFSEIPTISFDFAAARELISHGKTGFVAKNEKQFVKFIETLIENPKLAKKMGQNAKQKASHDFTWQKTGRLYKETLEKILKNES